MAVMAGDVAVGEICTTPAGIEAASAAAIVVPDVSAPMMMGNILDIDQLARGIDRGLGGARCVAIGGGPLARRAIRPDRSHALIARLAAFWSGGMKLARGPVTSNRMPTFTSAPLGAAGVAAAVWVSVAAGCAGSPPAAPARPLAPPPVLPSSPRRSRPASD